MFYLLHHALTSNRPNWRQSRVVDQAILASQFLDVGLRRTEPVSPWIDS
jgi:hypothetical protein